MMTNTVTIKYLEKYYRGDPPTDGINFTMSLFRRGIFSHDYVARCIMKILYLDDALKHEHITTEGWNAIYYDLDMEADIAQGSMLIPAQK